MVKTITVNLFFGTHLFVMVLWGMVCGSGFTPVYICVCVWGQPLFRRALITCPIFSYSSQFTSRGTRHPWPTVCNEATVLDGISGLITLTYLQLVTMFFHYPSFLMAFRLLFFNICMNNSRNRSPLRIFPYLPISATFVQCGQRRPSWTKHVNSRISSGALLGMKRLIDEIRSFKCVFGRDSVMVLSWSGNCRRVNSIPLIWLRPSTFSPPKNGGMSGPCPEKNNKAIPLGRFDHES